jgi:ATP-dependent DNA helicase RecG
LLSAVIPDPLVPLVAPLTSLRGVGPDLAERLSRACGGTRVLDLLLHLPEGFVDRRQRVTLAAAAPGSVVTLLLEVIRVEPPQNPRQPTRVVVGDASGFGSLVFFRQWPRDRLPLGGQVLVSGRIDERRQMVHPDHIVPSDAAARLPPVEPVWRLTAGLFPGHVRRAMAAALAAVPALPEWHDPALLARERWPGFAAALRALHAPAEPPGPEIRHRLAYDEVLADQLSLALLRRRRRARPGRPLAGDGRLRAAALARFGHPLTPSQAAALAEIDADLAAPRRMLRLLQGDVGSGKTLVAIMAMLRAVEAGAQAALMAPTELLAQQHARTLRRICPVPAGLLTGSVKAGARAQVLAGLAEGTLPLVVGTHALFQEGVEWRDLGLAVIDEQHRFGVRQRLSMGAKGEHTDVLVMTATPIPRTVLLTQWGEMEVSRIAAKPAGRGSIRTTLHTLAGLADVCEAVARAMAGGARVYWVCPLVAESEVVDLAAAEERYATLRHRFGAAVCLAHGRQEVPEREAALAKFASGQASLLVATTVIEVGLDVPEASVMVIEHAERFGLAQLHQLRGRIGRGARESFCLLLHEDGLNDTARRRLKLLRDCDDGFRIADEDFRIRGGGDLLGTRQSGARGFRVADPVGDEALIHMAARDAALLLDRDPELSSERGRAARLLLRLFGIPEALRTRHSG